MTSTPKNLGDIPSEIEAVSDPDASPMAVFGPPRKKRKPKLDPLLAEATQRARDAILELIDADEVGEHVTADADDDRVVTHRFEAPIPGYRGWHWYATLARAPRSKVITVCQTGMLPGDESLLAPEWVPWMDRASEEERLRLQAIADGKDPRQALIDAGFDPDKPDPDAVDQDEADAAEAKELAEKRAKKLARKEAKKKRRRSSKKSQKAKTQKDQQDRKGQKNQKSQKNGKKNGKKAKDSQQSKNNNRSKQNKQSKKDSDS